MSSYSEESLQDFEDYIVLRQRGEKWENEKQNLFQNRIRRTSTHLCSCDEIYSCVKIITSESSLLRTFIKAGLAIIIFVKYSSIFFETLKKMTECN